MIWTKPREFMRKKSGRAPAIWSGADRSGDRCIGHERMWARACAVALGLLIAGVFAIEPSLAGEKSVDRLEQRGGEIVVRFNIPVTYLSHAPQTEGSTLQIDLRPLQKSSDGAELSVKERVPVPAGRGVPLSDATYEILSPSAARLTLTFARSVKFRVAPGADSRSISVTVLDMGGPAPVSSKPVDDIVAEVPQPNPTLSEPVPETSLPSGEIADLMAQAREAMRQGDNEKAIRLLTRVLQSAGNEEAKPEALEMLGLARERNRQIAHAKAEYEEYLRLYPKGESADRVRQRLAGLITAASKPKARLREPSRRQAAAGEGEFDARGSFSQAIRREQDVFNDLPNGGVTRFDLDSNLDTTLSYSDGDVAVNLRGNGGYLYDLMEGGDNSEGRVGSLYLELSDPSRSIYGRLGRQVRSTDGVLGRFDGGLFSAQLVDELRVNLVGGMPVDSSADLTINKHRYFAGAGIELGPIMEDWSANIYGIHQKIDDLTDRSAVGGEFRFTRSDVTVFSLVDYDLAYNQLNIGLLSGSFFFDDRSTINFAVDYRTSPILTTMSALQGQPVASIDELLTLFSEPEIRQLARDRTAIAKSVSVGASHPFDDNFQISADFMVSEVSATDASGGVPGMPRTGLEYFYGLQFTGTDLFTEGDIAALGFRYADQDQFDRLTLDLNSRFPVSEDWRINPRIRGDYRWNDADDGSETSVKPSLRLNYRALTEWEWEFEFGGDWRKTETSLTSDETLGYFAYLTYRLDY
jgi:tetratricopeptide (TPR) repeat protein